MTKRITGSLAIGNSEKCPFCNIVLDDRPEHKGENIQEHIFKKHEKELFRRLFPEEKHDA